MFDLRNYLFIPGLILFTFFVLFVYTRLAGPIPFSVNSVTTTKNDVFTVTGEGRVSVKPDIAVISAGVTANGAAVKAVQTEIDQKIRNVIAAVKELGVEEKDIKTTNYSINPLYDYNGEVQRITGYNANSNLSIKIKNIDSANQIIDAVTANGANQIGNISFDVDDKTGAQNQAREQAVKDAKTKADIASSIAGFRLGKIISYYESDAGIRPPIAYALKEGLGGMTDGAAAQVATGENEVVVQVTFGYEIY